MYSRITVTVLSYFLIDKSRSSSGIIYFVLNTSHQVFRESLKIVMIREFDTYSRSEMVWKCPLDAIIKHRADDSGFHLIFRVNFHRG